MGEVSISSRIVVIFNSCVTNLKSNSVKIRNVAGTGFFFSVWVKRSSLIGLNEVADLEKAAVSFFLGACTVQGVAEEECKLVPRGVISEL